MVRTMGGSSGGLVDDQTLALPAHARMELAVLVNQTRELSQQVNDIERELALIQRMDMMAKVLSSIPRIGPITAKALAASVRDPTMFSLGARVEA